MDPHPRFPNSVPLTTVQCTPEDLWTGLGLFCSEALAQMFVSVCQDFQSTPPPISMFLYQRGLGYATHSVHLSGTTLSRNSAQERSSRQSPVHYVFSEAQGGFLPQ